MKQRKIPMRSCVGCFEPKPKKELIRIVRSPEGDITLDPIGKKAGRGAYICPNIECFKKARKAHRLERSFEREVPSEVYDALEAELLKLDIKEAQDG